jgi:hypothetical protein
VSPAANPVAASGNALIARVLPTTAQTIPQVQTKLGTQTYPAVQGTMDTFTAQYAPETYQVALASSSAPSVVAPSQPAQPHAQAVPETYAGTSIPYFDHEIEKIDNSLVNSNATIQAPLPTFASQGTSDPPPSAPPPTTQTTSQPASPAASTQSQSQPATQ